MAAKQYYNITAFPLGINTVDSDRDVRPNGFIYLKNFSLNNMQSKLDEILDKYIPEFPKQVQLNLPKLKLPKLDKKINSTLPKLQLPKLEKPKIDSKKETFPKLENSK